MLEYDPKIRIAIEPKPNEPMDHTYIPTTGHAIALGARPCDPTRVGVNIESAHAILAGLDPSDEMGFALAFGKLWTVHLNDQNGLKFDQDKTFGAGEPAPRVQPGPHPRPARLRQAAASGSAWTSRPCARRRRTAPPSTCRNSREIFLRLLEISRSLTDARIRRMVADRDYEELELTILRKLLGA